MQTRRNNNAIGRVGIQAQGRNYNQQIRKEHDIMRPSAVLTSEDRSKKATTATTTTGCASSKKPRFSVTPSSVRRPPPIRRSSSSRFHMGVFVILVLAILYLVLLAKLHHQSRGFQVGAFNKKLHHQSRGFQDLWSGDFGDFWLLHDNHHHDNQHNHQHNHHQRPKQPKPPQAHGSQAVADSSTGAQQQHDKTPTKARREPSHAKKVGEHETDSSPKTQTKETREKSKQHVQVKEKSSDSSNTLLQEKRAEEANTRQDANTISKKYDAAAAASSISNHRTTPSSSSSSSSAIVPPFSNARVTIPLLDYETSMTCPGCRHSKISNLVYCAEKMEQMFWAAMSGKNKKKSKKYQPIILTEIPDTTNATEIYNHWVQAHLQVSKTYRTACESCHPHFCLPPNASSDKNGIDASRHSWPLHKYWRLDRTAPPTEGGGSGVTHYLPSIPAESRFPNHAATLLSSFDVIQFMTDKWNQRGRTDLFVEYNPTLAVLPPALRTKLTMQLRARAANRKENNDENNQNNNENDDDDYNAPIYLASFRVSSNHACYPWENVTEHFPRTQLQMMKDQNYLGLALLRADLTMIPDTDLVVDMETQLGCARKDGYGQFFVDYRLFSFNDKIYLNINGSPVYFLTLSLEIMPFNNSITNNNATTTEPPLRKFTKEELFHNTQGPVRFHNKFGSHQMQLSLEEAPQTIFGIYKGKNYAFFQTPELKRRNGELAAELNVFHDRYTLHFQPNQVNLLSKCEMDQRVLTPSRAPPNCSADEKMLPDTGRQIWSLLRREVAITSNGTIENLDEPPPPTFATIDELWFSHPVFKQVPHGGACCAHLQVPPVPTYHSGEQTKHSSGATPGSTVLVGVGHTKIPYRRSTDPQQAHDQPHHQYVSMFYAFEPTPPYRIVGRSGLFCLPFASPAEEHVNAYHALTRVRPLTLKGHAFDCPQISFVSSIIDHGTDPNNKVIVSYGINDCAPRMVVIEKREIAKRLFQRLDQRP